MTLKEYQERALVTLKKHISKEVAIADWALGLGGELGEVVELINIDRGVQHDRMELAKEMGDVLWYICAVGIELDLNILDHITWGENVIKRDGLNQQVFALVVAVGKVQEACKHKIAHKEKTSQEALVNMLKDITSLMEGLCNGFGFTITDVAELNVAKLSHRYHNSTFTTEASANRHEQETKFTDTEIYKEIEARIG